MSVELLYCVVNMIKRWNWNWNYFTIYKNVMELQQASLPNHLGTKFGAILGIMFTQYSTLPVYNNLC